MVGPVSHVRGVVGGADDVEEVFVIAAAAGRVGDELLEVRVLGDRFGGGAEEGKIRVPDEEEGLLVRRPRVEHEVVLGVVAAVVVAGITEGGKRVGAEPLVHVEGGGGGGIEGRPRGQADRFERLHETGIIIHVPVVLDDEVEAIGLLVVAQVAQRHARDAAFLRQLQPLRAAGGGGARIVKQFVLEHGPVAAVLVLGIEKDIAVAGHLQHGRPGVIVAGRDHPDEVIVHAGQPAGAIDEVLDDDFVLAKGGAGAPAPGPIHAQRGVDAAEKLVRAEVEEEAEAIRVRAPVLAALEADAHVVIDLVLIPDHRRAETGIAHEVGRLKEKVAVRRGHDDAQVVGQAELRAAVVHLVERARVGAAGRNGGHRPERIGGLHVEVHHGAGGGAGNGSVEALKR